MFLRDDKMRLFPKKVIFQNDPMTFANPWLKKTTWTPLKPMFNMKSQLTPIFQSSTSSMVTAQARPTLLPANDSVGSSSQSSLTPARYNQIRWGHTDLHQPPVHSKVQSQAVFVLFVFVLFWVKTPSSVFSLPLYLTSCIAQQNCGCVEPPPLTSSPSQLRSGEARTPLWTPGRSPPSPPSSTTSSTRFTYFSPLSIINSVVRS